MEGQVVGLARLLSEGQASARALGIEIEGNGEVVGSREFSEERFLCSSCGDDLVIGLHVVDGAERDGERRDGGMLRRDFGGSRRGPSRRGLSRNS